MNKQLYFYLNIVVIGWLILTMSSCMPTRRMNGDPLLKKNVIKIQGGNLDKSSLSDFIQQEPNKRLLGVLWFKPWLFEKLDNEDPSNFNLWLRRSFADPPAYYNRSAAIASAQQMQQYSFSKGFFNAKAEHSVNDKDKATVTYTVKTGAPYQIKEIQYNFQDRTLMPFVLSDTVNTLIKRKQKYDVYILDDERDRVTKMLRNEGYYKFTKEYIRYRVDSTLGNHGVKVIVDILQRETPPPMPGGDPVNKPHKRYKIDEIIINPDQTILSESASVPDTLRMNYKGVRKSEDSLRLKFLYDKPLRVKTKTYARRINIRNDQFYNAQKVQKTYNGLAGLTVTQFVSMDFHDDLESPGNDTLGYLDCKIQINRRDIHSISLETEGTNTAGRPGIAARLVYQNKNIFRGGEVFDLSLSGALEAQSNTALQGQDRFLFFNTIEGGVDANLKIPKFLLPVKPEFFSRDYHPFTTVHTGYNYQRRTDYTRYLASVSLGYRWQQSVTKRHLVSPIDINAVKIYTEPGFEQRLQDLDQKYQEQYTDHLIAALKYSFIWNTQLINKNDDFFFLRTNAESSGLALNLLNKGVGLGQAAEGYSTLLNIRYAQYVRTDVDFRYYHYLTADNSWVFRTLMGIGLPYGNSEALPFEKGFYAGGANGLRGWELRSLGPGGYVDTTGFRYDRIGDIHLEFSAEYRFPIYSYLNGALFTDAGNIWLLKESRDYPNGHFEASSFISQMAVDAGFGLRVDLQFFILRVDAAMPLRLPSRPAGERWKPLSEVAFRDFIWNFGIGYPF